MSKSALDHSFFAGILDFIFSKKRTDDNHESISLLLSVDSKILIVQQINDVRLNLLDNRI